MSSHRFKFETDISFAIDGHDRDFEAIVTGTAHDAERPVFHGPFAGPGHDGFVEIDTIEVEVPTKVFGKAAIVKWTVPDVLISDRMREHLTEMAFESLDEPDPRDGRE